MPIFLSQKSLLTENIQPRRIDYLYRVGGSIPSVHLFKNERKFLENSVLIFFFRNTEQSNYTDYSGLGIEITSQSSVDGGSGWSVTPNVPLMYFGGETCSKKNLRIFCVDF